MISILAAVLFCSFTASAPTEIYTLSLHDALPICGGHAGGPGDGEGGGATGPLPHPPIDVDSGDHRQQRLVGGTSRSEEHTSELQSRGHLVCRLLLEKKKQRKPQEIVNAASTLNAH